jgi:hypothetical protein
MKTYFKNKKQSIMKTQIKKLSMLTVMFFVFAFARAGFIPHISSASACMGNDGRIVFSNLQSDGTGPFSVRVWSYSGFVFADSSISASADSFTVSGLAPDTYELWVMQFTDHWQCGECLPERSKRQLPCQQRQRDDLRFGRYQSLYLCVV